MKKLCVLVILLVAVNFLCIHAEATPIIVDGSMFDWAGVDPIVVDPQGDALGPDEDILRCYVANDGANLYFRIDVSGSIIPNTDTYPVYMVFLDVDQDSLTGEPQGDIGVEYVVTAALDLMQQGIDYWCIIMNETKDMIAASSAAFSDGKLEFTCPLSVIGYPSAVDMVFQASVVEPGTDTAPDSGHVTYDVEPAALEADGDPSDWSTIPWMLEDTVGDADYDEEDIVHCYVTHDNETLYLRVDVVGTITDPTDVMFAVYLDTDADPLTGYDEEFYTFQPLGIGADSVAVWQSLQPGVPDQPFFGMLWYNLTSDMMNIRFRGAVSGNLSGSTFEMAIPLSWLGDPDVIDMVFLAMLSMPDGTDLTVPIHYIIKLISNWATTTPTIDGTETTPGEWDDARHYEIAFYEISTLVGVADLWVKNDASDLYMLWMGSPDLLGAQTFYFDPENDGLLGPGREDAKAVIEWDSFADGHYTGTNWAGDPTPVDGEQSATPALYREVRIPLNSGDLYDMAVVPGDTIGVMFMLIAPSPVWPIGANYDDAKTWCDLVLASQPPVGGEIVPITVPQLIAPYILLLIITAGTVGILYKKHTH
jgi:hypothetical protein